MGKTYRYSPDNEDFGYQDHRVSRQDIAMTHVHMAAQTEKLLPKVILPKKIARIISGNWIPYGFDLDQRQEYLRQTRLDLLHDLGEQMIAQGLVH